VTVQFADMPRRVLRARPSPASRPRIGRRGGFVSPTWIRYEQPVSGVYRVEGVGQYELYVGVDANPDFTAAPAQTSAVKTFSYAVTPPGAGTKEYRLCLRYRSAYSVISLNQYNRRFTLDAAGDLVVPDPSGPEDLALIETGSLYLRVTAVYLLRTADGADAADCWDIYATTEVDPVPGVDSPTSVAMPSGYGPVGLSYRIGPYSFGDEVHVIVRCRRSSDDADDGNTDAVVHIMESRLDSPEMVAAF